jgi:hypothetical protein
MDKARRVSSFLFLRDQTAKVDLVTQWSSATALPQGNG